MRTKLALALVTFGSLGALAGEAPVLGSLNLIDTDSRQELPSAFVIDEVGQFFLGARADGGIKIRKLTPHQELSWTFEITGPGTESLGSVLPAGTNGVYVSGDAEGSASVIFGNSVIMNYISGSAFVARLDAAGSLQWVKTFPLATHSQREQAAKVVLRPGGLLMAAELRTPVMINGSALEPSGFSDVLIAALTDTGDLERFTTIAGPGSESLGSLVVSGEKTYVAGHMGAGEVRFGALTLTNSAASSFVASLDNEGIVQWAISLPFVLRNGAFPSILLSPADGGSILCVGAAPTGGVAASLVSPNGDLKWTKQVVPGFSNTRPRGITRTPSGEHVFTGDFGPRTIIRNRLLPYERGYSHFTAALDSEGSVQWGLSVPGGVAYLPSLPAVDRAGALYVLGICTNTIVMGSKALTIASGESKMYLAEFTAAYTNQVPLSVTALSATNVAFHWSHSSTTSLQFSSTLSSGLWSHEAAPATGQVDQPITEAKSGFFRVRSE